MIKRFNNPMLEQLIFLILGIVLILVATQRLGFEAALIDILILVIGIKFVFYGFNNMNYSK
jgi:uncharacterized membrane protein